MKNISWHKVAFDPFGKSNTWRLRNMGLRTFKRYCFNWTLVLIIDGKCSLLASCMATLLSFSEPCNIAGLRWSSGAEYYSWRPEMSWHIWLMIAMSDVDMSPHGLRLVVLTTWTAMSGAAGVGDNLGCRYEVGWISHRNSDLCSNCVNC